MKLQMLEALFKKDKTDTIEWEGHCHDCGKEIHVMAKSLPSGIELTGGAVYDPKIDPNEEHTFFLKCMECYDKDNILRDYQPVECYSRVVGYLRPVGQWNGAKAEEFGMRKTYNTASA